MYKKNYSSIGSIKKYFFFIFFFNLSIFSLQAQVKLSGTVYNNLQHKLSFVHIHFIGLSIGGITDSLGNFEIQNIQKGNYVLEFSSLGYKTQ